MSAPAAPGQFIFRILLTSDRPRASRFYDGLFGWGIGTRSAGAERATDVIVDRSGTPIASMMSALSEHTEPRWVPAISTSDVGLVCDRAVDLGGQVVLPAIPFPDVGIVAIVADAQGALFAPFRDQRSAWTAPHAGLHASGTVGWDELQSPDPPASLALYARLFGWTTADETLGGEPYATLCADDIAIAGVVRGPAGRQEGAWLMYVDVEQVEAVAEHAVALGGAIAAGPRTLPGVGVIAELIDPTGATFALLQREAA